jgi:2-(1,2-epoxy-1,2-dihydrophenyl)acetyl-CoA isomerase
MVPTGGSAYFLSKTLGRSKAYEILLSGRDISASEALALGIEDQVVTVDRLEEAALETANRFSLKPAPSLWAIKRLLNYSYKDLVDYMAFENRMFFNATHISACFDEDGSH